MRYPWKSQVFVANFHSASIPDFNASDLFISSPCYSGDRIWLVQRRKFGNSCQARNSLGEVPRLRCKDISSAAREVAPFPKIVLLEIQVFQMGETVQTTGDWHVSKMMRSVIRWLASDSLHLQNRRADSSHCGILSPLSSERHELWMHKAIENSSGRLVRATLEDPVWAFVPKATFGISIIDPRMSDLTDGQTL